MCKEAAVIRHPVSKEQGKWQATVEPYFIRTLYFTSAVKADLYIYVKVVMPL